MTSSGMTAGIASFLDEAIVGVVGTNRRDGSVQLNPAWFEYRAGHLWLNTPTGSGWLRHIRRNGGATILVMDPDDPERVVQIVTRLARTAIEGAHEHADRLARRYTGHAFRGRTVPRVVIELEPVRVIGAVKAPAALHGRHADLPRASEGERLPAEGGNDMERHPRPDVSGHPHRGAIRRDEEGM
jgi:PPOX class probable F420-dependent enzyme